MKKRLILVCERLILVFKVLYCPLYLLTSVKHDLLSFYLVVSKFEGWKGRFWGVELLWSAKSLRGGNFSSAKSLWSAKNLRGGTFVVGPGRHLASLRRWVQYFWQQPIYADFTINCQKTLLQITFVARRRMVCRTTQR